MNFTVEQAEYHRNGVSGLGFYVGIARCDVEGVERRMLVTFFPDYDDGETLPAGKDAEGNFANMRVSALDLDLLPEHGVKFGCNSWRGDNFCEVADAIVATVQARWAT